MRVEVRVAAPSAGHAARVLREAARAWVRAPESLSLSLVGDREMRRLNRAWRGKDKTTDVLSFPLLESGALGDVIISLDAARRQARAGGWSLRTELRRLLAHGLAHCRGHDHEDARGARRMAAAEERMLGARGMVGDSISRPGPAPAIALARRRRSR
jgi:probable rRNA maturation factor